jgi:small nuclear ribonucleoprotein (snRNP)-like protein
MTEIGLACLRMIGIIQACDIFHNLVIKDENKLDRIPLD